MKKGFTLLELMVALFLISGMLLSIYPTWQKREQQHALMKEQQKLILFLRQLQARVKNSQQIWLLMANRDTFQQTWCLTAQKKSDQRCDCFAPAECPKSLSAQFYYPDFPKHIVLTSKRYFPFEMTRFSGVRDTLSTACFSLASERERVVFSLFNIGSIKAKQTRSLSACENE